MILKRFQVTVIFFAIPCSLLFKPAFASGWSEHTTISGFMSMVYNLSNSERFFDGGFDEAGINSDGSFSGTKFGINIRSQVVERISFAGQLLGSINEEQYNVHVHWGFASVNLTDNIAIRFGKIKYPVGLVNEYVDVGVTYPWIRPPLSIYTEQFNGPQVVRESYTGASLLGEYGTGDWLLGADVFGGEVNLTGMNIKNLAGITLRADWNDAFLIQGSAYTGTMEQGMPDMWMSSPGSDTEMKMHDQNHHAITLGFRLDWRNILLYAEWAEVTMNMLMRLKALGSNPPGMIMNSDMRNADAYYVTIGYRIGDILPHITYQTWENRGGEGNTITSIGLKYQFSPFTALKFDFSNVTTKGIGLFEEGSDNGSMEPVMLYSVALDLVY